MGHTPIMDALWYLAPEVVRHLVTCKPNLNTKTHYGFSLWDHLEYETKVQATDEGKQTMARIKSILKVTEISVNNYCRSKSNGSH